MVHNKRISLNAKGDLELQNIWFRNLVLSTRGGNINATIQLSTFTVVGSTCDVHIIIRVSSVDNYCFQNVYEGLHNALNDQMKTIFYEYHVEANLPYCWVNDVDRCM